MVNSVVKKGVCAKCIEKQKTMPDFCCVFCALGIKEEQQHVDEFGTVHIDLASLFPDMKPRT
jgi:hypothetical protein